MRKVYGLDLATDTAVEGEVMVALKCRQVLVSGGEGVVATGTIDMFPRGRQPGNATPTRERERSKFPSTKISIERHKAAVVKL